MNEACKFQGIIDGIREDLTLVKELFWKLDKDLTNNPDLRSDFSYEETAFEIKEWIHDVFLDKIYEIDSKIQKFLTDVFVNAVPHPNMELYKKVSAREMEKCIRNILQEKKGLGCGDTYDNLRKLKREISNYRDSFNEIMDNVRKFMHTTNWSTMKKINIQDYILPTKRRKYVTAREELEKTKQAIRDRRYEEVLNHLRPAIELAIRERFGFTEIRSMKRFLEDAEEYNLPLPSYTMLYDYYDEGSHRLHSGVLNTPFECQKALNFVANFIDNLEVINISQKEIDDFKKKSKAVK